jgi:hypothetical protein
MYDYLVDHAIKNVWCTPDQDRQLIIQPAKITPYGGAWNTVELLWYTVPLPLQSVRFHVYQIGQIYPALMGLPDSTNRWTSFANGCMANNLIVDIYCDNGIQLPRTYTWYMITPNKNLVIAVMDQPGFKVNLNTDPLFLRVYSNAYFDSTESSIQNDYIKVNGAIIETNNDIILLQQEFNNLSLLPGAVYAFVNGLKVSTIDLLNVHGGDVVEYVYDSSIYAVIDLVIGDLKVFISSLDDKHKYLVHYSNQNDGYIDYLDDIDFFIIKPDTNNIHRHVGVYYHKNQVDAVRMVTHKDYSIVVPYAAGYVSSIPGAIDINKLTLRLHIRKSGYFRQLVDENNRIKELYKLPDDKLLMAMVGPNSSVINWDAATLEMSAYTKIMRSEIPAINRQLVQDAYGYNAISKLLANTPTNTHLYSGISVIDLPYGLIDNSVGYEYDNDGLLLGWYQHTNGTVYNCTSTNAKLVEMITGVCSDTLDEVYGDLTYTLDPTLEYRFYICSMHDTAPANDWSDVTNSNMYSIENNVVTWHIDPTSTYTLIRSNKNILAYNLSIMANNGLLQFDIVSNQTHNGVEVLKQLYVPMGELDIFLNGYSLIEGLDYIVNYPTVMIVSKKYLSNILTDNQNIVIRFTGFCNSDLTRNIANDTGFIKYGLLSHNNKFDIRDDKVLRIIVDGKLRTRNDLQFSETDSGVTVPNVNNGLPYSIRDIVVPLRGLAVDDTYTSRAKSIIIDKTISDYMTSLYPEAEFNLPNIIESIYSVYSPFCCRIIYDLQSGVLEDSRIYNNYTDTDVFDICKPYEYLLKYDLTQNGLAKDPNYVIVQPHNLETVITVNLYIYKFITRIIRIYLNGVIDISHSISIST